MKILVVDDEHDIQQLFEQRFRKENKNQANSISCYFSPDRKRSNI